jgi:hypothetical protein
LNYTNQTLFKIALVGFTWAFCFLAGGKQKASMERKMTLHPPFKRLGNHPIRDRTRMVLALAKLREEWLETVDGGSLLEVETPVGLLLADVVEKLGLTTQERLIVLGGKLAIEVDAFMEIRVSRKLPQ